jgi:hypothetical protein
MAGLTEFYCRWNETSLGSQFKWLEYTFKSIDLQMVGGGGGGARPAHCARKRNCRKKGLMVKDHNQLFMCIVVYVCNYSMEERDLGQHPGIKIVDESGEQCTVVFA